MNIPGSCGRDTPPARTDATLYACRDWIEQGFRGFKRAGWQWQRTRRIDPVRAGRHWLVLAVATLLAVAYGTRREEAAALGRPPRTAAHAPGDRPGPGSAPPAPQPPASGHGLPGDPAGPGAVVDAGLAAAPARPLRAAGRPRPGPGALTRHPATEGPDRRRTACESAVFPPQPEPYIYLSKASSSGSGSGRGSLGSTTARNRTHRMLMSAMNTVSRAVPSASVYLVGSQ